MGGEREEGTMTGYQLSIVGVSQPDHVVTLEALRGELRGTLGWFDVQWHWNEGDVDGRMGGYWVTWGRSRGTKHRVGSDWEEAKSLLRYLAELEARRSADPWGCPSLIQETLWRHGR
jgi:hypothetical protein